MAAAQLSASPGLPSPSGSRPGGGPGADPPPPPRPSGSGSGEPASPPRERSRRRKGSRKDKDREERKREKKREKKAKAKLDKKFGELEVRLLSQMSGLLERFQPPPPPPAEDASSRESSPDRASPAASPEGPSLSGPPGPSGDMSHDPVESLPGVSGSALSGPLPPVVEGTEEVLQMDPSPSDSEDFYPLDAFSGEEDGEHHGPRAHMDSLMPHTPGAGSLTSEGPPPAPSSLTGVEGLEDFALTGIAPAFSQPRTKPLPSTLQTRMWVAARGGETLQRVAVDKLMSTYSVGSGPFLAPPLPRGLISDRNTKEADATLRGVQQVWGTVGLAVTKSLTLIEGVVKELRAKLSELPPDIASDLDSINKQLSEEAVRPLSHVLRVAASKFNSHQARRKDKVLATVRRYDHTLGEAILSTPLATTEFFAEDVSQHIKEAQGRRATKDMLKAVTSGTSRQAPYSRPSASATRGSSYPSQRAPSHRTRGGQPPFNRTSQAGRPFPAGRSSYQGTRGRPASQAAGRGASRGRGASKE